MRETDLADELFGQPGKTALPAGVRVATARQGGVTITRVEIAREGLARPRQPLPRDLYPGDRHAALTGRCHAYPGGQGGFARLAEQFIGKVSFPHFASPIRLNFRIWALFPPKRYQKYGKMKNF